MRAVVLAGGLGTRMGLFTRRVGNKHVIPVYDRPMIEYPLSSFSQAGIKELAVVTSNFHAGDLCKLLGDGKEFGFDSVQYFVQVGEGGIADALKLVENFCGDEKFAVMLGDNIYQMDLTEEVDLFSKSNKGCKIFLKDVPDPHRFGVAEVSESGDVLGLEEKPDNPKSNLAATGLYFFDKFAFKVCNKLEPSARGELEITDVLNAYLDVKDMEYARVEGFWSDAGQPDSLLDTANWLRDNETKLISSGRFKGYRFDLGGGNVGDYISNG